LTRSGKLSTLKEQSLPMLVFVYLALALSGYWKPLVFARNEQSFDLAWHEMQLRLSEAEISYLEQTCGYIASSLAESSNAAFKSWLCSRNRRFTLCELVQVAMHQEEQATVIETAEHEKRLVYGSPATQKFIGDNRDWLKQLLEEFSDDAVERYLEQFEQSQNYITSEEGFDIFTYFVLHAQSGKGLQVRVPTYLRRFNDSLPYP